MYISQTAFSNKKNKKQKQRNKSKEKQKSNKQKCVYNFKHNRVENVY